MILPSLGEAHLRHTFASLLIAAGKNPLYIARQLGHYSAGFTLDTLWAPGGGPALPAGGVYRRGSFL